MSDVLYTSAIYMITNGINGKVYIGSALNPDQRWLQHQRDLRGHRHANRHLQSAWVKYGKNAFSFGILEGVPNPADLLDREQYYLDLKCASNPAIGYNICHQARSTLGVKLSQETKDRISKALRGSTKPPRTQSHRDNIRKSHLGVQRVPLTPEWKKALSDSLHGRVMSEDHKRRIGDKSRERTLSDASREKIRQANLGKKTSAETRAKMSAAKSGKPSNQTSFKTTEYLTLTCTLCKAPFQKSAAKERFALKTRTTGPFCSVFCRNVAMAEVRHHGHTNS